MTALACPGCGEAMGRERFQRRDAGESELDLCHRCRLIWFDGLESVQLAPAGVIALFERIHAHAGEDWRPLSARPACPRCHTALRFTHDVQRTNRFTYFRCEQGHGRLTTFFQFLREKHFVRSLTRPEVDRLRAHVVQVRCSGCGAPVNVTVDAQCGHCGAPLAILDADAVKRALAELTEQERRRRMPVDPAAAVEALLEGDRSGRRRVVAEAPSVGAGIVVELLGDALGLMMKR